MIKLHDKHVRTKDITRIEMDINFTNNKHLEPEVSSCIVELV